MEEFDASQFWENEYKNKRALNRYPFDEIVTFLFRYYPREIPREDVKILEVGCGAGNNLWFAAREGFDVTGTDVSKSALEYAKKRFVEDNLNGRFLESRLPDIPCKDEDFQIVFDRGTLTCLGYNDLISTMEEVYRVLKPKGLFYMNVYSDHHTSALSGIQTPSGTLKGINVGNLAGIDGIRFYSQNDLLSLINTDRWVIKSMKHAEITEKADAKYSVHAEWKLIIEKL